MRKRALRNEQERTRVEMQLSQMTLLLLLGGSAAHSTTISVPQTISGRASKWDTPQAAPRLTSALLS
jgi:hypothetical protein